MLCRKYFTYTIFPPDEYTGRCLPNFEAFFTRSFHLAKKILFMKSLLGVSEEPFLAATFASFQCLGGSRYIGREGKGMPHERFKPVHDFF